MEIEKYIPIVEAMLFASGDCLSIEKISKIIGIRKDKAEKLMNLIIDKYASSEHGIKVIKLEDKYQMCTKSEYVRFVKELFNDRKNMSLSQAAMEVLAIVAYNQPVTKSYIEQVRGVDCNAVVNNLIQKNLIEEKGRLEIPGKPLTYGTTSNFLRCFGISYIEELPKVSNSDKDEETLE